MSLIPPNSQNQEDDFFNNHERSIVESSRYRTNQRLESLCHSADQKGLPLIFKPPGCTESNFQPLHGRTTQFSAFREKVSQTHLPVSDSGSLTKKEFNEKKQRYRTQAALIAMVPDPYAGLASSMQFSDQSERDMNAEQKTDFQQHKLRCEKEMGIRSLQSVPAIVGRTSRLYDGFKSKVITEACSTTPATQYFCEYASDLNQNIQSILSEAIPSVVKDGHQSIVQSYNAHVERRARSLEKLGIPKEDTKDFYLGSKSIIEWGIGKKTPKHLPTSFSLVLSERIDYSEKYQASKSCFRKPKEFNGKLEQDLYLVQYHSPKPIQKQRSWQWFSNITEANGLSTINEVMDRLALLPPWGDHSHVTLVKVPKGERVKFLYGSAVTQINHHNPKPVKEEGLQYRFYDFNPKWIIKTRKITT